MPTPLLKHCVWGAQARIYGLTGGAGAPPSRLTITTMLFIKVQTMLSPVYYQQCSKTIAIIKDHYTEEEQQPLYLHYMHLQYNLAAKLAPAS